MIWRFVGSTLLGSMMWVSTLLVLIVALTVGVESASDRWSIIVESVLLHSVVAMVWLGPLVVGVGNTLAMIRMRSRGELRAFSAMGVGFQQIAPILIAIGVLMGLIGWGLSEWVLPTFAAGDVPLWVWTEQGPRHSPSGFVFQAEVGRSHILQIPIREIALREQPRMAPWLLLQMDGSHAEQTELFARCSRLISCVSLSMLSVVAMRARYPLLALIGVGMVLVVVEVVAWTMGAQGQIKPVVAGTVGLWSWALAYGALRLQSATRNHRPV